jgi:hypothetical protein
MNREKIGKYFLGLSFVLTASIASGNIAPLIKTQWGQGQLYQTMTPKITRSWDKDVWLGQSYLGCSAIASAQILNYYKYQNIKRLKRFQKKSNCYQLENFLQSGLVSKNIDEWGLHCTAGVGEGFDFSGMAKSLPSINIDADGDGKMDESIYERFSDSEAERYKKTASFIYKVSGMINSQYGGPTGAGAHPNFIERLFESYFGYGSDRSLSARKDLRMVFKDVSGYEYQDKEWENLIIEELKQGRPVIYSAYRKNLSSGHTFIIDGFKTQDNKVLFHINWGWGGTDNGYFDIKKLTDYKGRDWYTNPYIYKGLEPYKKAGVEKLIQRGLIQRGLIQNGPALEK